MKILIIGGVAGGATAAARLRRLSEENEIDSNNFFQILEVFI